MDYHSLIKKVEQYAAELFDHTNLNSLPYHNLRHTESVVSHCKQIGHHYQLNERDYFVVVASAWLHDLVTRLNGWAMKKKVPKQREFC